MRGRLGHTGGALFAAVVLTLGSAGCEGADAGDLAALAAMEPSGDLGADVLERLAALESVAAGSRLSYGLGITRVAVTLGE